MDVQNHKIIQLVYGYYGGRKSLQSSFLVLSQIFSSANKFHSAVILSFKFKGLSTLNTHGQRLADTLSWQGCHPSLRSHVLRQESGLSPH